MKLPGFLLRHEVTVEAKEGEGPYGPTYAAPVTVRCFVEQKTRLVRNAEGDEVVSSSTVFCQLDALAQPPPKSRVTLADGTKTKVIAAHRNDGAGLPTPDHFEIQLE
ncbi:hypothetical protein PV518_25005 [Streptomyces sp. ND04-05B]|uniref:hypothetical protein n=1 Tax=Streptomyces sp. ND04-05B TaxID=3028693 RepID=UPI0029BC819C|nr:hypothetical protein [Streptomyces sp. ND04-05B]MDX3065396.1 hypothetical protein [Streptomyces sp. ND04-05B]